MKKTYNPAVIVVDTTDNLEQTRRLYRGITDIAKRLDEQKSRSLTVSDVFVPSGEALRSKLRDYCERLIFKDFNGHARKTEELLWRKGFYEAYHVAKKLRKGSIWTDMEKALLSSHLSVGVGFYHHLILRLQLEYNIELTGIIDFAYPLNEKGLIYSKNIQVKTKSVSEESKRLVLRFIHRSLICIGDLSRYKLDLDPYWDSMMPIRYYKMAIAIDPNIGMPHNQLGTVASNQNYGLDAVYHYLRCILCPESFEGAEGNLRRVVTIHSFSGNEESVVHRCIARLLSLLQLWDSEIPDYDSVNQDSEALLNDIESCLVMERSESPASKDIDDECDIDIFLKERKKVESKHLTDDMIFKIVSICLMFITKLQKKESTEVQGVIAFTLALLSQILHSLLLRLQEVFVNLSLSKKGLCMDLNINAKDEREKRSDANLSEVKKNYIKSKSQQDKDSVTSLANGKQLVKSRNKTKSLLTKLRRPRKRINSSDSEASDIDGATAVGTSSDEMNSDISETEEDILSEELNALTDEDLSDDEAIASEPGTCVKNELSNELENTNGHEVFCNGKADMQSDNQNTNCEEVMVQNKHDQSNGSKKIFPNNVMEYVTQAEILKQQLQSSDVLDILASEGVLASIKICYDWLKSNPSIIKTCAKSSKSLLKRTCVLLNLINIDINALLTSKWKENAEFCSNLEQTHISATTVPLPEDIEFKGIKMFEESHKNLNWLIIAQHKMMIQEQVLLRVLKLLMFGKDLCTMQQETRVMYDNDKKIFMLTEDLEEEVKEKTQNEQATDIEHSRGKLMRHMGKLWLKAEVRALENRLHSRFMSPYLVPDHEALVKYMSSLKRLVYAKKFIIVIPTVVVSTLDEVKRTSAQAREATRWLEAQLKRGSRFLRAQRPHERLPLPLIKGPKPKDKESWLYFQIIECCHYLTQQTKVGLSGEAEIPVVTLLTGYGIDGDKKLAFSSEGLAKSAGVNVEHIHIFHTKWKASSKSHG